MISPEVNILTDSDLAAIRTAAFKRGVERGRFEQQCEAHKMTLHTPLRQDQLNRLTILTRELSQLRDEIGLTGLTQIEKPGDEEALLRSVTFLRGIVQQLDLKLFRVLTEVHDMWHSNWPSTPQPTTSKPKVATLDDVLGAL